MDRGGKDEATEGDNGGYHLGDGWPVDACTFEFESAREGLPGLINSQVQADSDFLKTMRLSTSAYRRRKLCCLQRFTLFLQIYRSVPCFDSALHILWPIFSM